MAKLNVYPYKALTKPLKHSKAVIEKPRTHQNKKSSPSISYFGGFVLYGKA